MKMTKIFIKTLFYVGVCVVTCAVNAAETGRSRAVANQNVSRMPTLPIVTMNTIGNPAVVTVTEPTQMQEITPTPPTPPTPPAECADGGVKNTDYTVSMCMSDLRRCIDSGAVEGGLHGLFNEDYFSRILNGNLRICQNVVDKCLTIRENCKYVYKTNKSVWADFRSRILWPEYYNFVLYKTGLTPNQAKKTCQRLGAKWDAVNADCIICVVAYNKNTPISNEWLFGAAGNGKNAEACLKTGESFTCNKSLFGFSLLNDTATVAATAIPGGAIVGGVIGGLTARAKRNKDLGDPCESKDFRQELGRKIESRNYRKVLSTYLVEPETTGGGYYISESDNDAKLPQNFYDMDKETCELIIDLYARAELYRDEMVACKTDAKYAVILKALNGAGTDKTRLYNWDIRFNNSGNMCIIYDEVSEDCSTVTVEADQQAVINANIQDFIKHCMFKPIQPGYTYDSEYSVACSHNGKCRTVWQTEEDLKRLDGLLNIIKASVGDKGKGSVGKGILTGAGIGAATGGLATGITALIESNNIKCVVGNDLASVGLNKSYKIDSLKDFYVKKGFSLPDTIIPTTIVTDKASWAVACSEYAGNPEDCPNAQVVYKHGDTREIISSACVYQGSMCLVNEDVAQSHLPK